MTSHFQTETEVLLRAVRRGIRLNSVPVKNIYHLNGNAPGATPPGDRYLLHLFVLQGYLKLMK
jgi:hypothetical protein